MNNSFNDIDIQRSESELTPICPNCGDKFAAIIGSEIVISPRCNKQFQLISVERMERGISHARINMDEVPTKKEREYWIGFTGGIRWTKQQERFE